jgi:ATP-binding protein involved in chromosome partitioning
MGIRESSDAGEPVVVSKPDSATAKTYRDIAAKVWDRVNEERGAAEAAVPSIVFE